MSNSDLIRKYFPAYENKDRKNVESLLTNNFVFASPYDYRIDRKTISNGAGPIPGNPPPMALRSRLKSRSALTHSIDFSGALRMPAFTGKFRACF
jgi:hypothetical protein